MSKPPFGLCVGADNDVLFEDCSGIQSLPKKYKSEILALPTQIKQYEKHIFKARLM